MGTARSHAAGVRAVGSVSILAVAAQDGEIPVVAGRNGGNLAILGGNLGELREGNRAARAPSAPETDPGAGWSEELDGVTLTRVPILDFRFRVRVEDAARDGDAVRTGCGVAGAARFTSGTRKAL